MTQETRTIGTIIRRILIELGYEVCEAADGVEAVKVVGAASNGAIGLQRIPQFNPDVITLDIEMPDMDGMEMMRRIRREYPRFYRLHAARDTQRAAVT